MCVVCGTTEIRTWTHCKMPRHKKKLIAIIDAKVKKGFYNSITSPSSYSIFETNLRLLI